MLRKLALPALLLVLAGCTEGAPLPTENDSRTIWTGVAAGTYFSCATTADDTPHCWGFYSAAPGSGGPHSVTGTPVRVPQAPPLRQVTVGGGIGCGLDQHGRAYCWGQEFFGELGNGGSPADSSRVPVPVQGGLSFSSISAGYGHVCAVTRSGEAYCWGGNLGGVLGTGVLGPGTQRAAPARVAGDVVFASISAGTTQSCGVATDGRGYCWGGGYGSVGVPHLDPSRCPQGTPCAEPRPQLVSTELRFTSISAGNGFTCGVATSGAGYCWGGLFQPGQPRQGVLGNGSTAGSATPVAVAGGHRFSVVEAGTRAACALDAAGAAYCWGGNGMGELGIGTMDDRAHPAPQAVDGGIRFRALSLGEASCGVAADSALYCWGTTYGGLLGNGEVRQGVRPRPTRVADPQGR